MEQVEYFRSREDFQDLILATMIRSPSVMRQIADIIDPAYFSGYHSTLLAEKVMDFYAEFRNFPTFVEVRQFLEDRFGPDEQERAKEVIDYVNKIEKIPIRNSEYIRDNVAKWCREQAVIRAVQKTVLALKAEQWPEEGFAKMFEDALAVGTSIELGYSLTDDVDKVVAEITAAKFGVRTGFRLLDDIWYNGWAPGWLIVPVGPPKGFKSTYAINLALNMTEGVGMDQGVSVFHYTCEISSQLTLARAYCALSGQEMRQLYQQPDPFLIGVKSQLGERWGDRSGTLLVKSFPAKSATIGDIRTHARHASDALEVTPRVIIIDHAEVVRANKRADKYSDWRQQADIYAEARALGQELGATVIMPDRCNRETVAKPVPDMTSFQGSFEKAGVVDVAIGLCQTEEERAMADKFPEVPIRYFVFLNRHGPACGYFGGTVTQATMRMSVDKRLSYREELEAAERKSKGRRPIPQRLTSED